MEPTDTHITERIRALADSLDCVTSEDLRALADITEKTEEAWAKRHTGPDYIIFGNARLYPRAGLRTHLERLTRKRSGPGTKGGLL